MSVMSIMKVINPLKTGKTANKGGFAGRRIKAHSYCDYSNNRLR